MPPKGVAPRPDSGNTLRDVARASPTRQSSSGTRCGRSRTCSLLGVATGLIEEATSATRRGLAALQQEAGPSQEQLLEAAVAFRRARRLESGQDLRAWLAARQLTMDDWEAHLRRSLAARELAERPSTSRLPAPSRVDGQGARGRSRLRRVVETLRRSRGAPLGGRTARRGRPRRRRRGGRRELRAEATRIMAEFEALADPRRVLVHRQSSERSERASAPSKKRRGVRHGRGRRSPCRRARQRLDRVLLRRALALDAERLRTRPSFARATTASLPTSSLRVPDWPLDAALRSPRLAPAVSGLAARRRAARPAIRARDPRRAGGRCSGCVSGADRRSRTRRFEPRRPPSCSTKHSTRVGQGQIREADVL